MEETGASGQTSCFWFWPCSCCTAKALQLWVPLPPSCKTWFIKTWPSLQGAERCRILLVPLEGITWACWGPAASTGVRESPVTFRSGTELPWQGRLALGQLGCSQGGHFGKDLCRVCSLNLLSLQEGALETKLVTAPLPHCWPFQNDLLGLCFLVGKSYYLMVGLAHHKFSHKPPLTQVCFLRACPWTLSHILNPAFHNYSSLQLLKTWQHWRSCKTCSMAFLNLHWGNKQYFSFLCCAWLPFLLSCQWPRKNVRRVWAWAINIFCGYPMPLCLLCYLITGLTKGIYCLHLLLLWTMSTLLITTKAVCYVYACQWRVLSS